MEEGLYTRNPPGEEDSASPEDKAPRVHGNKLKNKDSARRYYEQKLRTGKADNSMTPEEKQHRDKIKKQTQKKAAEVEKTRKAEEAKKKDRNVSKSSGNLSDAASKTAAGVGVMSDVVNSTDDGKGESAVAEEVFDIGGYVASGAVSHVTSKVKSGKYSKKVHGKRELSGGSTDAAKERARKELQRKMIQKQAKAAEGGAKFGEKVGEKASDVVSAIGEWMKNFAEEHPVISIIVVLILLVVLVCAGFLNSCAAIGSGVGDVTIVTSYTAKDEDILAVEDDYKELEDGLQDEIDEIDTDGYDEVNYYLDEVGHNPYQLAAILTVIFEAYTRDEVQAKLQEIFELQYEITTEEVVETREREVEDVRWVEDDSYEDGGYWETYTYTEEETYNYYILKTTLVNNTMDKVVREWGLNDDQMGRYEILLDTYGNKKYLFEDDIYAIVDPEDEYDVPPEALTDTRFANIGTAEFSFENMADQMKGDLKEIRSSLNKVSKASRDLLNSIDGKINELKAAERGAVEQSTEPLGDAQDTPLKGEDTLRKRDVKSLRDSLLEKLRGNKENVDDRYKNEIRITGPNKDRAI